ncbi:MAG: type II toxin-antitoxin system VapC family toxin [Sphingomonas sp.]
MTAVLLDTCAVIWIGNGDPLSTAALSAIERAAQGDGVLVSAVSAWEIGLIASRRSPGAFDPDPVGWFDRVLTGFGVKLAPCTPAIMIASSALPDWEHRDPADRLIVATARSLGVPVITRDKSILAYAGRRCVAAIAC